jgi:uncharacterized protein YdeI (YjbR/CyaY-like superfamily)
MTQKQQLYFKNDVEWRSWLHENHDKSSGIFLVFYKLNSKFESMRWEEAVKVAICYGWIDSTVKKLDEESRQQWFSPRKDKSVWSKLNKTYIVDLLQQNMIHPSGLKKIEIAKQNGTWESLDAVENLEIPTDLQNAFDLNIMAFTNYQNFSMSYRKNYLYWLNQAKRSETRQLRIEQIIGLCEKNIKNRP